LNPSDGDEAYDEDEEEDEEEEEEDEEKPRIGARPQRLPKIKSKIRPIPPYSSFFVFSPTNKWVFFIVEFYQLLD
jgi:voltage-dependent calcium channel L type alpha-1D